MKLDFDPDQLPIDRMILDKMVLGSLLFSDLAEALDVMPIDPPDAAIVDLNICDNSKSREVQN